MYKTLNKIMFAMTEKYINQCIKDGIQPTDFHFRILSGISGWKTFNSFTLEEAKKVNELQDNKELKELIDMPASFLVFTLQLIKMLYEYQERDGIPKRLRPYIGISEKKLKTGRALFAIDMLKLKHRNSEQYEETKQIIDESVEVAEKFFNFYHTKIVEKSK